jgi:hypothetical protein
MRARLSVALRVSTRSSLLAAELASGQVRADHVEGLASWPGVAASVPAVRALSAFEAFSVVE